MTAPAPLTRERAGCAPDDAGRTRRFALVVEDLPDVRAWLADALRTAFAGIEVGQAGSLAEARAWTADFRARATAGDLLYTALIDLGLPDGSGIELVREFADRDPTVMTIVATIYDDDGHLFPAIAAGAHGYLLKEQEQAVLVQHLTRIGEGLPPLSPSISRRMLAWFRERADAPAPPEPGPGHLLPEPVLLSPRETEVLSYIGRGLRVAETARLLNLTEHTIAGYVKSLYRKLNISSRAEAALEAARRGLV